MLKLPFHTKRRPIHDIIGVLEKELDPVLESIQKLGYEDIAISIKEARARKNILTVVIEFDILKVD
jgi:hypothetical protein